MEMKTLVLGLFMSLAAFAVKAGGGLAYLFLQTSSPGRRLGLAAAFSTGYALVFGLAALVVMQVDLTAHLDWVQGFFKSGMTLHFMMASLLAIWGTILLKQRRVRPAGNRPDRFPPSPSNGGHPNGVRSIGSLGWLALVVPCPVCFSAILLSGGFVHALFPDRVLVFPALFTGFILMGLVTAGTGAGLVKDPDRAGAMLGWLMLSIAVYFFLTVILVPQFNDMDRIYRISLGAPDMQIIALLKTFIYLAASSLFLPVLLILSCLLVWMLVYSGTFFRRWLERRQKQWDPDSLPQKILDGSYGEDLPISVVRVVQKFEKLRDADEPVRVVNLLRDSEHAMWKSLDMLKMLIRIGPGLGLIGTLIPMGTGLVALGQGDLGQLSQDLVVAFTTTVAGMALGLLAYFYFTVQRRWVEQDIKNMELAAELLVEEAAEDALS